MNDNLELLERQIDAIPVPHFNFVAVAARAAHLPVRTNRRRAIVATLLIIVLPALAAATAHFVPLRVTHRVGNWQLYGPSRDFMHPTTSDFSKLARQAPYHVVWPVGMPGDHKLLYLSAVGSEVFLMAYNCPGKNASYSTTMVAIIPRNYKAVNPNLGKWFVSQIANDRSNELWDAGDESVVLTTACLTREQVERIRNLTIAASRTH
ncbi:MAG TPA: hypothetical protein VIO32_10335 [Candidatus Baltobacteraceae bacterium]